MNDILHDLREADRRGVCPPQNWTTRAADEIERLRAELNQAQPEDSVDTCPAGFTAKNGCPYG